MLGSSRLCDRCLGLRVHDSFDSSGAVRRDGAKGPEWRPVEGLVMCGYLSYEELLSVREFSCALLVDYG